MKQFITCPNCGAIELATIEETVPFWSYIHNCSKCGYVIMESEWNTAKAISIRQPWASLIVEGVKDIENRTWKTKFRGRVLVHAGENNKLNLSALSRIQYEYACENLNPLPTIDVKKWDRGAIIGSVEIVDCIINHDSIWADKSEATLGALSMGIRPTYNWVLANQIKFPEPIPSKGQLSFFTPQLNNFETK